MRRLHLTFPKEGERLGGEIFLWPLDPAIVDTRRACRILTRRTLARFLQIEYQQVALTKDALGRPALDAARMSASPAANELDFSCSHSENLFAVGVMREGRIGIDLEVLRPENVPADCRLPRIVPRRRRRGF